MRDCEGCSPVLEGPCYKHVHEDHNAEGQDEQRELLYLHCVFLRCCLARHNNTSFLQNRSPENGSNVVGTRVT